MQLPIYLDYNATTPCLPEVIASMLPYFSNYFGNAASKQYAQGWLAEEAVEIAREQVANLIQASPKEIIFTGGATEALNWALKGYLEHFAPQDAHIITVSTEHKAVLDTCAHLMKKGVSITFLPVDFAGGVSLEAIQQAIQPHTKLLCIMLANNETGILHNLTEIYAFAQSVQIPLLTDATQAVGKIPVNAAQLADFLCFSAHKMYGPKGVGALYINSKSPYKPLPLLHGGGQEKKLRSGTLNVPAIVGFGKAAEIAHEDLSNELERLRQLRDYLEQRLLELPHTQLNGSSLPRLAHVSNITFKHLATTELLAMISTKVAVSTGSACSSVINRPSHVLTAMGIEPFDALNSIRFSLGKYTTLDEIQQTVEEVSAVVQRLQIS